MAEKSGPKRTTPALPGLSFSEVLNGIAWKVLGIG
jgi:hypothetical protein